MKPKINKDLCIGCGVCESICQDVFKLDDDGKARVIPGVDYEKYKDSIEEAKNACSVGAITISD